LRALEFARQSVIVNLLGVAHADRCRDFARQNLKTFLQLAEGVDDETWMLDLRNGDYSAWFESNDQR
jgi:hypothetical protein